MHKLLFALLTIILAGCAEPVVVILPGTDTATQAHDAFNVEGVSLPRQVWRAENPKAILIGVHGFNDYGNAFIRPAPWFAERGVTVYAYDQRGFGRTAQAGYWHGAARMRSDLKTIISEVNDLHPGLPVYVMGHSLGGAVVLSAMAAEDAPVVDGVILAAPAVWGWSRLNPIYKSTLWLAAHIRPGMIVTGSGIKIIPSDNREALIENGRDPLFIKKTRVDVVYGAVSLMDDAFLSAERAPGPLLYLYGERDQIIPEGPTEEVMARLPTGTRIARYAAGYHMLLEDLQREVVYRDILTWIVNPAAPLPSGAEVQMVPQS